MNKLKKAVYYIVKRSYNVKTNMEKDWTGIYNDSLGVNSRGGVLGGIIEIKGYLLIIIIMCISKILSFKGSKNYGKDN